MRYGISFQPLEPKSTTVISAAASQRVQVGAQNNVQIAVGGAALWIKFGDSTVTATAGTASEIYVPAGWVSEFVSPSTHVAMIQDAATAEGSLTVF